MLWQVSEFLRVSVLEDEKNSGVSGRALHNTKNVLNAIELYA